LSDHHVTTNTVTNNHLLTPLQVIH
jgi:hypothetical protein